MSFFNKLLAIVYVCFLLFLTSCSGGDDGDGTIGTGILAVEGVVATGFAVAGAIVTLKDSAGNKETTITEEDGTYRFNNIEGMTPPFLLRVIMDDGTVLFSVSENFAPTNIHPITDIVVRNWFKTKNKNQKLEDAFEDVVPILLPIANSEIQTIVDTIKNLLALAYIEFGVTPHFNFMWSHFSAKYINSYSDTIDGSEFDVLLDHIKVKIKGNEVTLKITDPKTGVEGTTLAQYNLTNKLNQVDTVKPNTPKNLVINPSGAYNLRLDWESVVDNVGVAGYNIYKDTPDNLIASSAYPVYVDDVVWQTNTNYCYFVEAFDAAGNLSNKLESCFLETNIASVTLP